MNADSNIYVPLRDQDGRVVESPEDYAARMHIVLPYFPGELLIEWLHRHAASSDDYCFLGYGDLRFTLEEWDLARIPGREAFKDGSFCDSFSSNFDQRAKNSFDWLARYMKKNGTWNTPVVLLGNIEGVFLFPNRVPLRQPYHLIEGHRRLSFLVALRNCGGARKKHQLWIARIPGHP